MLWVSQLILIRKVSFRCFWPENPFWASWLSSQSFSRPSCRLSRHQHSESWVPKMKDLNHLFGRIPIRLKLLILTIGLATIPLISFFLFSSLVGLNELRKLSLNTLRSDALTIGSRVDDFLETMGGGPDSFYQVSSTSWILEHDRSYQRRGIPKKGWTAVTDARTAQSFLSPT